MKIFILSALFFGKLSWAQVPERVKLNTSQVTRLETMLSNQITLTDSQKKIFSSGEILSYANVDSPSEKQQKLDLIVVGVHPRNCVRAMRKISLYENYSSFIDFIKKSDYNNSTQQLSFTINHTLLPYAMVMSFKLPRITGVGSYPFVFEHGFLKDLKGEIGVQNLDKFCVLTLKANWQGKDSGLPNLALEMFAQTLSKLGLEHLIRLSLF
jgi:hypothetical protein